MVTRVVLREPPPVEVFLEVEIFSLINNEEKVAAFVGGGNSYKNFKVPSGAKKDGETDEWKLIGGNTPNVKVFQLKLEDELWKVEKDEQNKKTIRIQAKRKHVAWKYDDGKRAREPKTTIADYKLERDTRELNNQNFVAMPPPKNGKWSTDVKLEYRKKLWPIEESLAYIYFYQESEKSEYDKKKTEKVLATLNKILILEKEDNIEYVVDRFVSV